jgi:hypothetical protein
MVNQRVKGFANSIKIVNNQYTQRVLASMSIQGKHVNCISKHVNTGQMEKI